MKNKNIFIAIIINIFITFFEVAVGLLVGSLALVSDAAHNFSDVGAMSLSWWGERVKERGNNKYKTYGYKRVEVLVALFNALILFAVVVYILFEAVQRIFNPAVINGASMIIMSLIALIGNGAATFLLEKDAHKDLNMKSAWLHSLQDALFSLGVVIGAILIYFFHWYIIDPIISMLLALYVIREVYELIEQTVNILMESVPEDIDFDEVKKALLKLPNVIRVNDVHIWQTDSQSRFLSAHLHTADIQNGDRNKLLGSTQNLLKDKFMISHATIQMVAEDKNFIKLNCNPCN